MECISLDDYRQLRQIVWHVSPVGVTLTREEALAAYERNWRHVDQDAMDSRERELLKELIATVGKGVFLG